MKTYIITEEDIVRLIESFNADSHKYWYEDKVDKWEESLKAISDTRIIEGMFEVTIGDFNSKQWTNETEEQFKARIQKELDNNGFDVEVV